MGDYGNPLKGKQRTEIKPIKEEVIKKQKPKLKSSCVKSLLDYKEDVGESILLWTERWLEHLIRQHSYPPQILSSDVLSALNLYLTPKDSLSVLEEIRKDFRNEHLMLFPKEDFSFLLKAFEDEKISLSSQDHLLRLV